MNGSRVAVLVRGWVDLYTRGMPADARAARRDEVDDDLWCEHEEAETLGRSARSLDADRVLRLLFGMPADISWRLAYRRHAALASVERSSSMGARAIGASAIIAVLSFGFMGVLTSTVGSALGTPGDSSVPIGVVVGAIALFCVAFMVAALGLAMLYQDRIGPLGGIGASVVAFGAFMIIGAGFAAPLFVGSAMLMWDLARIGVVSRLVPIVHVATAILFVTGIIFGQHGVDQGDLFRELSAVSFTSYMLTWGAIGVSLIRGAPKARAPSA
jgi:hypothetical protein